MRLLQFSPLFPLSGERERKKKKPPWILTPLTPSLPYITTNTTTTRVVFFFPGDKRRGVKLHSKVKSMSLLGGEKKRMLMEVGEGGRVK